MNVELFKTQDYREILKQHFTLRLSRNPRYSQGAFARDLGLPANRLSEIMAGKQGISARIAEIVARRLDYKGSEFDYFCDLVSASHSRSREVRRQASLKIKRTLRKQSSQSKLNPLSPSLLTQWFSLVILEVTRISKSLNSAAWYASKLNISEKAAQTAIDELIANKCIIYDKASGIAETNSYAVYSNIPSESIKQFHDMALGLASNALFEVEMSKREFNSAVIPMKTTRIEEFKIKLQTLINEFADTADQEANPDQIYMVSAQLFPLIAEINNEVKKPIKNGSKNRSSIELNN